MPYSEEGDLLVGDMPLPKGLRAQKYVDDAADEIDSMIGFIYKTPVPMLDDSPATRPARLLLKRLNNLLASGRLIMAMTTGGQRLELHAYGASLVSEATKVLNAIAAGDVLLTGAELIDPVEGQEPSFTGPQIANVDEESNVEAFYNRVANPEYLFPLAPNQLLRKSGG